jgi:hypothetical protein
MTVTLASGFTPALTVSSIIEANAPEDNSKQIIIIWQKSKISDNCKAALATITSGVHIWDPVIDGSKLDAKTFANASYNCLILWAGDKSSKTAAADVHQWYTDNRDYIKSTNFTVYVIPKKLFSFAGIKSVYEDAATAMKALPKWHPNLEQLLLKFEEKFPESEVTFLKGLFYKILSLVTKKE